MNNEDYCTYKVAKLLKEKGFDWVCIGYYVDYEPDDVKYSFLGETNSTWESRCCSAPTLQMAMKWLREIHKLHIGITRGPKGYHITIETIPLGVVKYITKEITGTTYVDSYEEACEAAIKYCLKNLI